MIREDYQRIWAEIDLDAISKNLGEIKANLAPETSVMAVIKTDGYGHGAVPIAREMEKEGSVSGYAVATAEEALILRHSGIRKPILVLGYTFPYSYERLIMEEISMTVFCNDTLQELSNVSAALMEKGICKTAKIHIKVDTGMSRIGIRPDEEGIAFVQKALETKGIKTEGIFTHFARADEEDKSSALRQLAEFENFLKAVKEQTGEEILLKHCSNSAGIIELPMANMDLVRAGIILYGLWPSQQVQKDLVKLIPALSLYSRIIYIKEIKEGTPVSYGGTFTAPCDMRIATVPAGYGDGYPRGLSGKGYVLVHGKKAAVLGRVCMDQFMIDVTDIESARQGDKVTLIGKDGEEKITMEMLGELSGRFNYELACSLGKRIPRVYMKGGKILCTKDYYQDF